MKKLIKQTLSVMMAVSLLTTINYKVVADDISVESEYDLVEYDYVNRTERIISADEIFDYSATTTTTYELDSMATYVAELEQKVSPCGIIDPSGSYDQTSPVDANGNPVPVYSGVMYVMIGLDTDGDGFTNNPAAGRATGFLVAPNVLVTAAHIMVDENFDVSEIRVIPFYHDDDPPYASYSDYVYPEKWVMSTAYTNNWQSNPNEASKYDWCIIKLQEDIPGAYCFECTYDTSSLLGTSVAISGYPSCGDKNCTDQYCDRTGYQITSTGIADYITTHNIFITNNAKPCHSGSPVYSTTSKKCCAVFTQGNATINGNIRNKGVLITQFMYNVMASYASE